MIDDILFALWFFLPAAAANAIPIFLAKAPLLANYKTPLDFGLKLRGKPVFGKNKTYRGLIGGIIIAIIVLWLQQRLFASSSFLSDRFIDVLDYSTLNTIVLGALFGLGALGGDAIESFFKRQLDIAPGKSWFPFDQIDYIVGASIATFAFVQLSAFHYFWLFVYMDDSSLVLKLHWILIKVKRSPDLEFI